ncbi:COP9 signalosome complex subunit 7b [Lepeophtheirus salmonis]|uniref:COP9 signalosome complex subunit 7a n=1 Tax=Lepeophtheirus salmonis TaxID=72036 RepID=C1BV86_LEPSM|nr:COP9 signalosome complex subunit 7a-like [Lepeophtheirus salmonis]ACO12939.1 COP9 signalosome complex subunit 7a [Lepeophtheirus salmonis]ADD38644.1 COP9 signalosome complex subunit 7a [Lepeophtheirus salmonis]
MGSTLNGELEQFLLLGKSAKGAAASSLILRVLEASGIYVFGELLDLPNITALGDSPEFASHLELLKLFAYGTYKDYSETKYPPLTDGMQKKLRLLTLVSLASGKKILKYEELMKELNLNTVRELEDLIIEGSNSRIIQGKLDQKSSHFEVDFAKGRDIKKEDISSIINTLTSWCDSCDGILSCLEQEANRANGLKAESIKHKNEVSTKHAILMRSAKDQQINDTVIADDPDSRMDVDRSICERRDKKGPSNKSKGTRTSGSANTSKGGGNFWQK